MPHLDHFFDEPAVKFLDALTHKYGLHGGQESHVEGLQELLEGQTLRSHRVPRHPSLTWN